MRRDGSAQIKLHAATGHRQRYGLTVGNNSLFPWAPTAGTRFTFAGVTTTTTPGSSSGSDDPYAGIPGAYRSLLDPTGQMAYDAGADKPYWVSDEVWESLGDPDTGTSPVHPTTGQISS